MKAPEYINQAVLETLRWTMIFCRNYTLKDDAEIRLVNDLMEATHDVPDILMRWPDGALDEIKLHLGCFDHEKWEGSPNLVGYFESALVRANS